MKKLISLSIVFCLCCMLPVPVRAQELSESGRRNEQRADSLYRAYEFARAAAIYNQMALTAEGQDRKRLEEKAVFCQNGEAMLHYVSEPKVVTRKTLDKKDFFLYYPNISTVGHFVLRHDAAKNTSDTLFLPNDKNTIYYSARDSKGVWNIYTSRKQADGVWSAPQVLGNNVTSSGNDIFPFVSPDGKRLYFSSNGHYGAGGYDLYVSYWDDEKHDWGVAQNMGFPYSSPSDDFFFYITPDGKYAAFSSTRVLDNPSSRLYSTSRVVCYVVEYESDPIKHPATAQEAANIARLRNAANLTQQQRDSINNANIDKALEGVDRKTGVSEMDPNTRQITENYTKTVLAYRQLKKERGLLEDSMAGSRSAYSAIEQQLATEEDSLEIAVLKDSLKTLASRLTDNEATALNMDGQMREAEAQIRRIEEIFLSTGVSVPGNTLFETSEDLASEASDSSESPSDETDLSTILDKRAKVTENDGFVIERPKLDMDLTFKVQKKSVIVDGEDFPEGLRYQIKLITSAKKLNENSFKGFSPIFERTDNGRYVYSAGAFNSYSDAYKQLSRIRKAGFTAASIIAFEDGKAIPVAIARKKETASSSKNSAAKSKDKAGSFNVAVYTTGSSLESQVMKTLSSAGKDVAKISSDEGFKFIAGPFSSKAEAEALADKLKDITDKKVVIESLN